MNVGDLLVKLGADFSKYTKDLAKAEGMAHRSGSKIGGVFGNAVGVGLGIVLAKVASKSVDMIKDFVLTAGRTETLNVAMQAVARSAGVASSALDQQKKSVMELGIAEQEATQILTRFMQAQLDTADAAKLARVAQDAAVVAGYNSSEAAEQMTEAIAKQRPQLLAAFGMTRNLNDIYSDHAKTIGKTSNKLTEAEKKQAMLNYVLKEGEKVAGAYEASMGSAFKKLGSMTRYVDTFKNAIATPLALPAFGVIIDGITDALKRGIDWAETNKIVLQAWGQGIANAIGTAWNVVSGFTQIIIANWGKVAFLAKISAAAFLSYFTVTKAIKMATEALYTFRIVNLALAGESVITGGVLGFLSKAIGIYKLQIHLASLAGIAHVGVLQAVRTALYSVWVALGPIGWAVLALIGVLTGGMILWNKYSKSVGSAGKSFRELENASIQQSKSAGKGADAMEDQADAFDKASEAATKSLMSFDEVHQLQEDMGDAASDAGLDMPTLDEIAMPDVTDIMAGLEDGLEMAKPTLAGFWNWIKQGFVDTWDWVKEKTGLSWQGILMAISGPIGLTAALVIKYWDEIKGYLSTTWNWISGLATGIFGPIGTFISSTWKNLLTTTVDIWDSIWTFISNTWNNLWTTATTIWNSIWTFLSDLWGNIKQTASIIWQAIADLITGKIDLRTAVTTIWNAIKDFFFNTWSGIRDTASDIWGAIAGFIIGTWQDLKTTAENIWNEIATFFYDTWDNLKLTAQQVWGTIKDYIVSPIQAAWERLREIFGNIKTYTLGKWDEIKQGISSRAKPLIDAIKSPFNIAKDWIAGIIDDAYNWGKNLIENITKGIKATVGKVKDAVVGVVDTVKGYIGFSSPTKEGPGRYADQWAPNLIRMYADGIIRNTGLVKSAASTVASSLSGISRAPSTPAFAGATAGGGTAPEIHLHVGALIADDYGLKKLEQRLRNIRIYEDQRVGDTR